MVNSLDELIAKAKLGDEESYKKLFEDYKGVIFSVEKKYFIRLFDTDDWLQEGRIALYDAIMTVQNDQHVTFGLYFKILLENRIHGQLRRQEAMKRKGEKNTISIEDKGLEYFSYKQLYDECLDEKLIIKEALENFSIHLSLFEAQVFEGYIKAVPIPDIAEKLGKSQMAVLCTLSRVKRKIKKELYYQE